MTPSTLEIMTEDQSVVEVFKSDSLEVYIPYCKKGYPESKILEGVFIQSFKGEKKCEGIYQAGKKHGVWAYYMHNPYHPMVKEHYENDLLIKREIFQEDGHHLRTVLSYDAKEALSKQIVYGDDGATIVTLDIYQNGLIKEHSRLTHQGHEQIVYRYNAQFNLCEKKHFLNDELVKTEAIT